MLNILYPLGLTLLHMLFSSVLCFVLTKVLKILNVEEGMTLELYTSSVIPIGAMFAMTLCLGNIAYLYISVAFAQILKAVMPVAVFVLAVAAGLEVMSLRMLLIMAVISFGVLVASEKGYEVKPDIHDVIRRRNRCPAATWQIAAVLVYIIILHVRDASYIA